MPITIEKVTASYPKLPTVAGFLFEEWGHRRPGNTVEKGLSRLQARAGINAVPSVFVAELDGSPVGTASIVETEISLRPQYSPWLHALYVHPKFRGRGYGQALVQHIEVFCREAAIDEIFLATADLQAFYERLEWSVTDQVEHRGELVTVMKRRVLANSFLDGDRR